MSTDKFTPVESRQNKKHTYRSKFGRSTVDIDCPFCGVTTTAYVWSLSGSGKKCVCGAKHGIFGTTAPKSSGK